MTYCNTTPTRQWLTQSSGTDFVTNQLYVPARQTFKTTYISHQLQTCANCNSANTTQWDIRTCANQTAQTVTQWVFGNGTQIYNGGTDTVYGFYTKSKKYQIRDALNRIFEKMPAKLYKKMTEDEKKLYKAKQVSEKLLKQWLSTDEWKALKHYGYLEVPSKLEQDCIYIIKKDPNEMVEVHKDGKYMERLCVISESADTPVGDQLLSKLLLLKTDEKQFRLLARRHP